MAKDICPENVFELARHNVILQSCVTMFRMGTVTWDKAMMIAAVMLAEENRQLLDLAKIEISHLPNPLTFKKEDFIKKG